MTLRAISKITSYALPESFAAAFVARLKSGPSGSGFATDLRCGFEEADRALRDGPP
jgi:hypothetical protein